MVHIPELNSIVEIIESIYTISITSKENKFRANMKILRKMIRDEKVDTTNMSLDCLSSCLWYAVLDRDAASVEDLMKHKPDLNFTRSGIHMLWISLIYNDVAIGKMLIEGGADVNVRISEGGPSFLHFLATVVDNADSLKLAKMMIEKGADVNARVGRLSVLLVAVTYETVPFVDLLLANKARYTGSDLILLAACKSKTSELLTSFINSIRDVEDRLLTIFRALQHLIESDVAKLDEMTAFLQLELPILDMNVKGWTLLRTAVSFDKIEVVQLLLEFVDDANKKAGKGSLPLLWSGYVRTLKEAHKLIIKHIATMAFNKDDVNPGDLAKIRDCPKMSAYYDRCLRDLQQKKLLLL